MGFNVAVILREAALARPHQRALVCEGFPLTYAQVDGLSDRVAANLRARGLVPGARVGLHLPNVPQFVLAYFGILKAGGVVVPLNVMLKASELSYHLRDADAEMLITWSDCADEAMRGVSGAGRAMTVYTAALPGDGAPPPGSAGFDELLEGSGGFEMHPTQADDTAVIVYTSGTSGRPRGAELSHFTMYMNCDVAGRLFGVRAEDVSVAMLPLFHVYGLSSVLNVGVRAGATLVLVPRFDAAHVLRLIEQERITVLAGVPTMYFALLQAADQVHADLSSLRLGSCGGSSMPGEVLQAFERRFGVTILEGYGLSETASAATFNRSIEDRRVLSVGKPMWGVEVKIVDEHDQALPAGSEHIGELVIRGHNVMTGYWRNPAATVEAMRSGWFHSGDLGYRDADGYFFIVDRKKDLLIRGGYNVYPREVEEVLYGHPAVAEAAVVGVPDERLGEEVAAFVSLKPAGHATQAELIAWCRERMAAYKYPRSVEFRDSLPKGPTGKILKSSLRAERSAGARS